MPRADPWCVISGREGSKGASLHASCQSAETGHYCILVAGNRLLRVRVRPHAQQRGCFQWAVDCRGRAAEQASVYIPFCGELRELGLCHGRVHQNALPLVVRDLVICKWFWSNTSTLRTPRNLQIDSTQEGGAVSCAPKKTE